MTVYIGVGFHPYEQSVAYADESDGEIRYKRFLHSDKQSIKAFYRRCGTDAMIGVEATGCLWWFEKLLFENGMALKIGDPRMIRRVALSRHKNDFRDAETILDLLMRDQFPAIVPRSDESREVLKLERSQSLKA
jgi:transposase